MVAAGEWRDYAIDGLSDPQVIWDPDTSRFYYAVLDFNSDNMEIGFSKTGSPSSASDFCKYDVDFGYGTAKTTYGVCGVKVWVFKGEILAHDPMAQDKRLNEGQPASHERGRREALG